MAKTPYPSETADRYIVRFPEGLRDRIKDLAAANGRSMNSQIIYMLQFALEETELAGAVYGEPDMEKRKPLFLKNEVRKAKAILEHILADYESEGAQE